MTTIQGLLDSTSPCGSYPPPGLGLRCTVEDWCRALANADDPGNRSLPLYCLTPGQTVGLTVVAQSGFVSIAAIIYVLFRIGRNMRRISRSGKGSIWDVFQNPNDMFMFSLFVADVLQSIGAIMNLKWIGLGKLFIGGYCTAQGVVQQLGETAVAFSTFTIAAYTFFCVWLNTGIERRRTAFGVLCLSWIPIVIVVIAGNTIPRADDRQFISPTPYWCWISQAHMRWRIGGEYFWFWWTLFFSIVSNFLLFLYLRGNILLDEDSWWRVKFQRSRRSSQLHILDTSTQSARRRKALEMLAYPLIYCCTIVPVSAVRWVAFVQEAKHNGQSSIPSAATFTTVAIHDLSGLINVVLLLTTRSGSNLFSGGITPSEAPNQDNVDIPLGAVRNCPPSPSSLGASSSGKYEKPHRRNARPGTGRSRRSIESGDPRPESDEESLGHLRP